VFLAPQLKGDMLISLRRRQDVPSVLVEGCQAGDGRQIWTTHAAAPIVALAASESRQVVDALTQEGRLYTLPGDTFQSGRAEQPTFSPTGASREIFPTATTSADNQTLVWTEQKQGGRAYTYELSSGKTPVPIALRAAAAAPAQRFGAGLLAQLADGSVAFVPAAGGAAVSPFLPPITPGELPLTQPAILPATAACHQRRPRHNLRTKQDQPQPQLLHGRKPRAAWCVAARPGRTAIGIVRLDGSDSVAGFDAGRAAFELIVAGRVLARPSLSAWLALVAASPMA
jgi:hypothetical protein